MPSSKEIYTRTELPYDKDVAIELYAPTKIRGVEDYEKIYAAENPEFRAVYTRLSYVLLDAFVDTCGPRGAERFEGMLGLRASDTDTIAERRDRIRAAMRKKTPYTERRLKEILDTTLGKTQYEEGVLIDLDIQAFALSLGIPAKHIGSAKDLYRMCRRIIPANITLIEGIYAASNLVLDTTFLYRFFLPKYAGEIVCGQWPEESTRPQVIESDLVLGTYHHVAPNRFLFPGEARINEPNIHNTIELEENYDMVIDQGDAKDTPENIFDGGDASE